MPKFVDAANEELEVWAQVHCEKAMEVLKGEREPVDEPVVFGGILSGIVKEEKEKGVESAVYGDWVLNKELGVASEMIDECVFLPTLFLRLDILALDSEHGRVEGTLHLCSNT